MSSCILMLDFDGVTHPDGCFDANFFCRLPLIEEVLYEFPSVQIVISSSWRDHYSLGDMTDFFSPVIGARIVGITPNLKTVSSSWLPTQKHEFERQRECELWMKENRQWSAPWMSIDDRPYWFEPE